MKKIILFVTIASFCNLSFALDGEGWGEIIKGVTEILHENQQSEIKQKAEQERLEQQRLQEQQAEQLRLQSLQVAKSTYNGSLNQGCKLNDDYSNLNNSLEWKGACKNGYVDGVGQAIYEFTQPATGKTITEKLICKFNQGAIEGLCFRTSLNDYFETDWVTGALVYFNYLGPADVIGPVIYLKPKRNDRNLSVLPWYDLKTPVNNTASEVTYEHAMSLVQKFMGTKNGSSMNVETLKAYLEGKISFDASQTVAQASNGNSSTLDDPPVAGIRLSLGGNIKSKK